MIRSALGDMDAELLSESVTAHVMCSCDGVCEDLGSTRGREIFFAMHHAIHHNAIINASAETTSVTRSNPGSSPIFAR